MKPSANEKLVELLLEVGCGEHHAGMLPMTAALTSAVHDLTWPRSMTWTGLEGARFIRPIRWIVAVLDGKPLKLSVAGVAAGRTTRGHRFLGSSAIPVGNFLDYEKKLQKNGVIVRPSHRQEKIAAELDAHPKRGDYRIPDDPSLRKLGAYLNEVPSVIHRE